jgi:hypothetical protein
MLKKRTSSFASCSFGETRSPIWENIPAVWSNALLGALFAHLTRETVYTLLSRGDLRKHPCGDSRLGCPGRAKLAGFLDSAGGTGRHAVQLCVLDYFNDSQRGKGVQEVETAA